MAGTCELWCRELVPSPAVQYPARLPLTNAAHPDHIRRGGLLQPVQLRPSWSMTLIPAPTMTVGFGSERTPLHR
jgi:hypothetical protein